MLDDISIKIFNSFFYWLDDLIISKAKGFSIKEEELFFKGKDERLGVNYFSSTNKQWVYGTNTNVEVPIGATVNGTFKPFDNTFFPDFDNGRIISTTLNEDDIVSCKYSHKTFNLYTSNDLEEGTIFEKDKLNEMISSQKNDGIQPYKIAFPACVIMNASSENQPYALGTTDVQVQNYIIRVVTYSQNTFYQDAVQNVMKNSKNKNFCIIDYSETPLNEYGNIKSAFGGIYNYKQIVENKTSKEFVYISNVKSSRINIEHKESLQIGLKLGFVDFYLEYVGNV